MGFCGTGSGVFTGFAQAVAYGVVGEGVLDVGFGFALQAVEGVVAVAAAVGAGNQVADVDDVVVAIVAKVEALDIATDLLLA